MKEFFAEKSNKILVGILATLLASSIAIVLIYFNSQKQEEIVAVDFKDYSVQEVEEWCQDNNIASKCKISFEFSDTIEENHLIYQSIENSQTVSDEISFVFSKGKEEETIEAFEIKVESSKEDVEEWAKKNGIENIEYVFVFSNDIPQNNVISIEPNENLNSSSNVVATISKGAEPTNSLLSVSYNAYINITESDFLSKMMSLGLSPTYTSEHDDYSNTIEKGYVIWHGSGEYEANETIRYSLSLGESSTILIEENQFLGFSEEELEDKLNQLKLNKVHNSDWDDYSDSIEKGKVIKNGYGHYSEDEDLRYGLSLGKITSTTVTYPIEISSKQYANILEEEFIQKAIDLGLNAKHNSDWDDYSDSIEKGYVLKHGVGNYTKEEDFRYGLSLGKKSSTISYPYTVSNKDYYNISESEFQSKATSLGLNPVHNSDWDEYSNSVTKGNIIYHGYGNYTQGEDFRYGLSLGIKNEDSSYICVVQGTYIGYSEQEFSNKASELNLIAVHITSLDAYSDTIEKGNIVNHGYSDEYIAGENISYGLSLGKSISTIQIVSSTYIGNDESDFKNKMTGFGLTTSHSSSKDDYSSSVTKGNIIWVNEGTYNKGDSVSYGLSLGSNNRVTLSSDYIGKSEAEFLNALSSLGLTGNKTSEEYSDTISIGNVISYTSGSYEKGNSVSYVVSKGKEQYYLTSKTTINSSYAKDTYDNTVNSLKKYFNKFTNVTYIGSSSYDYGVGIIISISVNGTTSYKEGYYDKDVAIVVNICNQKIN